MFSFKTCFEDWKIHRAHAYNFRYAILDIQFSTKLIFQKKKKTNI